MENEPEVIKKYLPMLFELDFNIKPTASMEKWYTLSWEDFSEEMSKLGVCCDNCKIRDWKEFFLSQHKIYNRLEL